MAETSIDADVSIEPSEEVPTEPAWPASKDRVLHSMNLPDEEVARLATYITGHPDAAPSPAQLAAVRALLGGLAWEGWLNPPQDYEAAIRAKVAKELGELIVDVVTEVFRHVDPTPEDLATTIETVAHCYGAGQDPT